MKARAMELWKHLSRYAQGVILIMVSVLFFAWGVFGSAQVANQTASIVRGVHEDVAENFAAIQQNQVTLLAEGRYITCVLRLDPDHRTPRKVHACLRRSGLKGLTP